MYDVYLVTDLVNGKHYVGITQQGVDQRFKEHLWDAYSGSPTLFHQAIRDHGIENFKLETIESNIPDEVASEREQYYICAYDSFYANDKGYNMTYGGNGTVGYEFTDDARQKISKALKGRKFSAERNQRLREIMTGREYKPEWKAALSKARLGRFEKEDNPFYGKHHTDETKQKLRESRYIGDVLQIDNEGNIVNVFLGFLEAGKYISESGVSTAAATTCGTRIREVARSSNPKCTAYGFHWKLEERSID